MQEKVLKMTQNFPSSAEGALLFILFISPLPAPQLQRSYTVPKQDIHPRSTNNKPFTKLLLINALRGCCYVSEAVGNLNSL